MKNLRYQNQKFRSYFHYRACLMYHHAQTHMGIQPFESHRELLDLSRPRQLSLRIVNVLSISNFVNHLYKKTTFSINRHLLLHSASKLHTPHYF